MAEANLTGKLSITVKEAPEILLPRTGNIPEGIRSSDPLRVIVEAEGSIAAELLRLANELEQRRRALTQ